MQRSGLASGGVSSVDRLRVDKLLDSREITCFTGFEELAQRVLSRATRTERVRRSQDRPSSCHLTPPFSRDCSRSRSCKYVCAAITIVSRFAFLFSYPISISLSLSLALLLCTWAMLCVIYVRYGGEENVVVVFLALNRGRLYWKDFCRVVLHHWCSVCCLPRRKGCIWGFSRSRTVGDFWFDF